MVLSPDYSANNPFDHLAPQDYYLKVGLTKDNGCFSQYGPFALVNQSGPSLDEASMQITNSTCSKSNGAIHNISYRNANRPHLHCLGRSHREDRWQELGPHRCPSGKIPPEIQRRRRLRHHHHRSVRDKDDGTISYDASHMVIQPSSCKGDDGAVTGINPSTRPDFSWFNTATGNVIGRVEDLSYAEAGTYQLQFSNAYGCTATTNDIIVTRKNFQDNTALDVVVWDASCDADNGYITINRFSADPSLYFF